MSEAKVKLRWLRLNESESSIIKLQNCSFPLVIKEYEMAIVATLTSALRGDRPPLRQSLHGIYGYPWIVALRIVSAT